MLLSLMALSMLWEAPRPDSARTKRMPTIRRRTFGLSWLPCPHHDVGSRWSHSMDWFTRLVVLTAPGISNTRPWRCTTPQPTAGALDQGCLVGVSRLFWLHDAVPISRAS